MILDIHLLRTEHKTKEQHWQTIPFDTALAGADADGATVATALTRINALASEGGEGLSDTNGEAVKAVAWECSCLQKRCGACAMVIDGRPRLACDAKLSEFEKKGRVTVEPLKKFPVVEDLVVDRSVLQENLKHLRVWRQGDDHTVPPSGTPFVYEGSRCLQCGICLEVCPNFYAGGSFYGTASAVPAARVMALEKGGALPGAYRAHVYEGCGKSLACRNICPAEIDIDRLLARNAGVAVWHA